MIRNKTWRAIVRGIQATRKQSQVPVYILAALNSQFDVADFKCEDSECRVAIRGAANIFDWHAGHRKLRGRSRKGITGLKDILKHRFDVAYLRKHFMLVHNHCNGVRARSETSSISVIDSKIQKIKRLARSGLNKKAVFTKLRLSRLCTYSNFCNQVKKRGIIFKKKVVD